MLKHENVEAVTDRTLWDSSKEYNLEVFDNKNVDGDYICTFNIPEFTSLCPWSGFPDFATIKIAVIPGPKCVELKSLKLYINSFRDLRISHETVPNRIMQEFIKLSNPKFIKVIGDFGIRGNIKTIVRVENRQGGTLIDHLVAQIQDPSFDYAGNM